MWYLVRHGEQFAFSEKREAANSGSVLFARTIRVCPVYIFLVAAAQSVHLLQRNWKYIDMLQRA